MLDCLHQGNTRQRARLPRQRRPLHVGVLLLSKLLLSKRTHPTSTTSGNPLGRVRLGGEHLHAQRGSGKQAPAERRWVAEGTYDGRLFAVSEPAILQKRPRLSRETGTLSPCEGTTEGVLRSYIARSSTVV